MNENGFMSLQNRGLAHTQEPEASPFCTGKDDPFRIYREICRLPEYTARLKPVIPDYDRGIYKKKILIPDGCIECWGQVTHSSIASFSGIDTEPTAHPML